jgi:hypothetical protein
MIPEPRKQQQLTFYALETGVLACRHIKSILTTADTAVEIAYLLRSSSLLANACGKHSVSTSR